MDGIHDMGGMHGFGPVPRETDEPVFHADWERRAVGIEVVCESLGLWNIDQHRYAIELIEPARYLADPYYARWLAGTERLLDERGIVTADELAARVEELRRGPDTPLPQRDDPGLRARLEADGEATKRREPSARARFAVGDAVRGRNEHPAGHTRIPRYARGREGTIVTDHGVYAFADTLAAGQGEHPQRLYTVAFDAGALWGSSAEPASTVHLDLFETYLEPAT